MKQKQSAHIPMELENGGNTQTFNSSWNIMKWMVIIFGVLCLLIMVGSLFFAYQSIELSQNRAFFVTNQGTMIATSATADIESRKIEIENHIKLFYSTMYSFDERNFKENLEKGLHLIGNDGKSILLGYQQNNLHEDLIKSNGVVNTVVDSVWIDVKRHPYTAKAFARQSFETPSGRIENFLWAKMKLKEVSRSSKNVHGLLIEDFDLVNNDPVN